MFKSYCGKDSSSFLCFFLTIINTSFVSNKIKNKKIKVDLISILEKVQSSIFLSTSINLGMIPHPSHLTLDQLEKRVGIS